MNNQFSLGVLWQRGDDFIVYPTSTMTSWYVIASKRYRQSPSHWASLLEKEGGPTKRRDPPPQAITSETVCLSRLIVMLHVTEFLTSSTVQVSLTCSQRGTQALQSSFPTPPPPPPQSKEDHCTYLPWDGPTWESSIGDGDYSQSVIFSYFHVEICVLN